MTIIEFKSKEEIEDIAFRALRKNKDKTMLNNRNIDCYVAGWQGAERDCWKQAYEGTRREFKCYLQSMSEECEKKCKIINEDLGYSGYMYSMPKSADAMLKMLKGMIDSCNYILANFENVCLSYRDYYEKLKGGEK